MNKRKYQALTSSKMADGAFVSCFTEASETTSIKPADDQGNRKYATKITTVARVHTHP